METVSTIADTGFIVALLNRADARYADVQPIYLQQRSILVPQTVLAEVAYLVGREAGIAAVATFLKGLSASKFRLIALTEADVIRTAEILDDYADSRIDFVDATVMAVAERLALEQV